MKYHGIIFGINAASHLYRTTGAHRIATVLRHQGMDVEVIDWTQTFTLEELKELVRSRVSSRTVFFGFSPFFNLWKDYLDDFTAWLKKEYPEIRTVIGGNNIMHCTAEPKNLDYWVDGYAEVAIIDLFAEICGVSSRPIKYDPFTLDRKLIRCHSSYPAWPMSSYITLYEKRDFIMPYEVLTTEISRGCRFKCDFCNFPVLGVKGDYSRTVEDFEHEMRHNYDNWGVVQYNIADETFNDRSDKIEKFIPVINNLNFRPWFTGFIRADLLLTRREQWQLLEDFQMHGQFYGIESLNRPSLKTISKGFDPERIKTELLEYKRWKEARSPFRASVSLIHGLPYETKQTLAESRKYWETYWFDQNVTAHALDLGPEDDDRSFDQTNVSSFRKNLEKYGIRKMPQEKIIKNFDPNYFESDWNEGLTGVTALGSLAWEHDTMNIYEAANIAAEWQHNFCFKTRVNAFNLNSITISKQKTLYEIPNWQDYTVIDDSENGKIEQQIKGQFILSYKNKKLNIL